MLTLRRSSSLPVPGCSRLASCPGGPKGERPSRLRSLFRRGQIPDETPKMLWRKKSRARRLAPFYAFIRKPSSGGELEELRMLPAYSLGNTEEEKEIHDLKVQLTSTAEKEQDYLNQLLTLKTDLEQKAPIGRNQTGASMKNLKKQVENKTKCIEELQQENKVLKKKITAESKKTSLYEGKVNKLQLEIENMNKQHKEAVDIYQKDIETRKVNENKLHEEVEKMKLLYDEATMIQRETDIRCQHKITEMVALMEKHKNEYDKMVEEKDAELKIYKIRQQKQLSSERALENLIKEHSRNRSPESEKKHKIDCKVEEAQTYLQSRAQGKSKKCFSNWIVIQTALSTRTFWVSTKDTNTSRPVYREWHGFGSKQPVLTCHCPLSMNMSPWPATAISNSSSISHFLLLALPDTRQLQLLHFCFFLSIPLAALLGNSLIISTTACGHHLHTPMFFFLLNLALTHLGSICTTVPKAMYSSLWDTRHISYAGCAAQVSIFFCLMSVEYFLLTIMRFDHYVSICKFLHYGTLLGSRACAHMAAAAWASAFLNALMHTANTFSLPLCQGNALGQFFCEIPHILKLSCSKSYLRELGLIAVTASLLFGCFVFIVFS
ncbi:hypothetical protein DUI87_34433 [Hirundo rustica rustica]|uniref:G-protein coupled receptors family 1 profile domain-containing protein n=1 Tax=Hirundo rustica rustica TaxID=333673 RepID=A0A3M0II63_HIRRU|nr:hypothetical protein DUI87_34433 [Hirundo rustica rustica]